MTEVPLQYDWTIHGDIDVTVSLTLGLDCDVRGDVLMSVYPAVVFCRDANFSTRFPHKFKVSSIKSKDGLPEHVRNNYAKLFIDAYRDDETLRDKIFELVAKIAVEAHHEVAYAA